MVVNESVSLTVCITFLRANLDWMAGNPEFPIEDFAGEVHACRRALSRWDPERESMGTMVKCPTLLDEGECGYRLHYVDPDEQVTCRRCGVTRDAMTLVTVALSDGDAAVWVDPEAAARETGVPVLTLKRWAGRGLLHISHSMYDLREIHRAVEQSRQAGYAQIVRRVT